MIKKVKKIRCWNCTERVRPLLDDNGRSYCPSCGAWVRLELDLMHYLDSDNHYLCIKACTITKTKVTRNKKLVTCKNCLKKLGKLIAPEKVIFT